MVADDFSETERFGCPSIKQTAQTAMCLPISVIKTTREVANEEKPILCLSFNYLNKIGCKAMKALIKMVHCRPYRKFLYVPSLKAATTRMKRSEEIFKTAQIYQFIGVGTFVG